MARRQREKAQRLTRVADAYDRGAAGEEGTARALAVLPASAWLVMHDVRWPGRRFANIDHVVVGPGGVFVIDSKAWQGRIEVRDNVLRQNGRSRETAVAGAADAAIAVTELVPGLHPDAVMPVLCFDTEEPLQGWARDVMVCSRTNVAAMLQSRPAMLDQAGIRATHGWLHRSLASATASTPPRRKAIHAPPSTRAATAKGRPRRSGRSGGGSSVTRFVRGLAGLAMIVIAIAVLPGAMGAFESRLRVVSPASSARGAVALGTSQVLVAGTGRPPLRVTAQRVVTTRAVGPTPYLFPGNRFVAVRLVIHNQGRRRWVSQPGTTATLIDDYQVRHQSAGVFRTRAGKTFPAVIRLLPGRTIRGYVVFQVRATVPVTGLTLTVGPGAPASVSWAIDHQ